MKPDVLGILNAARVLSLATNRGVVGYANDDLVSPRARATPALIPVVRSARCPSRAP